MENPNMNYIEEMAAGDDGFKQEIISIIKTEFPLEWQSYVAARREGNYKNTADAVHKLKHKISILGLEKGYAVANTYENNLNDENFEGMEAFEAILQNISDFVGNL